MTTLHSIKKNGSNDTSLSKGWYVSDGGYKADPPMTRESVVSIPYMDGEYDMYSFKNPGKPLGTVEYTFFKDFDTIDSARSGVVEFMRWLDTFHLVTLVDSVYGSFAQCSVTSITSDTSSCKLIPTVTVTFKAKWPASAVVS